jgi:hypothetical protein
MDETKRIGFRITFPDPGLTPEQKRELEEALKSTVAAVLMERIRGQVNATTKVNDVTDGAAG